MRAGRLPATDTAPLYGLGKAEERLGEGLRRSGKGGAVPGLDESREINKNDGERGGSRRRRRPTCRQRHLRGLAERRAAGAGLFLERRVLSYDDSVRRLGENVKICGLRCHDPETKLLESLAVRPVWKSTVLAPSSRARHRAGVASMAWKSTR